MIRRPPRSTQSRSSAASDVYKRQLLESRHDALDSPSTPCIRVPSPLAWGRNNVRELRAQMRHVLGDGGRGSIITASPFSYGSAIGVPAVDYVQRQQYELLLYERGDAVRIEPRPPSPSTCRLCARSSWTLFRPQASGDGTGMQSVLGESRASCRLSINSRVGSNTGSQQQQYEESSSTTTDDGSHPPHRSPPMPY